LEWPTAQQADAEVQVTLAKTFSPPAAELGEATTVHELPSQCSVSVDLVLSSIPCEPTAQQSEAVAHEISLRTLFSVSFALGEATTVHEFPSQRSMKVAVVLPALRCEPTAQQSEADTHVTP
jgi:hypothetical protein